MIHSADGPYDPRGRGSVLTYDTSRLCLPFTQAAFKGVCISQNIKNTNRDYTPQLCELHQGGKSLLKKLDGVAPSVKDPTLANSSLMKNQLYCQPHTVHGSYF